MPPASASAAPAIRRSRRSLFDEPTAHLDASLRAQILDEVARRRAADGAAAIYATHDAAEALAIADRVAVLHSGALAQATPRRPRPARLVPPPCPADPC
jgi:ABC-type sugar transport system ATPase subunit